MFQEAATDGNEIMVLGYIMLGVLTGTLGAAITLALGASFWSAFGIYTLSGCAGMILLPVGHGMARLLTGRHLQPAHQAMDTAHPKTTAGPRNDVFTVLAVDDDPFILDLVKTIGTSAGRMKIVTATSGAEALALLTDETQTFDYLLCDVSMPEMNGIALCQAARKMDHYRDVPVVMLTARRDMDHMAAAFRAGATDYATKPFDIEALRMRFQDALASFEAQGMPATSAEITPHSQQPAVIEAQALSTYLTRLSAQDALAIRVMAIKFDDIETLEARHDPARLTLLRDRVTATVARSLTTGQTMMAWTADSDLLVATSDIHIPNADDLEQQITADLQAWDPAATRQDHSWACVSIGKPIPLQGTRSRRANLAIRRATAQAADISLSRDRKTIANLRKALGT